MDSNFYSWGHDSNISLETTALEAQLCHELWLNSMWELQHTVYCIFVLTLNTSQIGIATSHF